ncbi:hypothetical protein QWZ06_19560 [Chryseobacterium tructae]|uniref:Uncharacterized protein n=1 Tax=Chryseobacterium tructae TaxID=1037380 RepID=A0ABV7Y1K6_9FLAO|nr:hypothetical protein [Chryseobacterium tructae]MDN3694321.1 hypothetical protein [Chryseobacterium tructae]
MNQKYTDLRTKILAPADLILFDEVIGTMTGGFYRSSYIMAWVNIIESLKNKLYQLAALEDSRAKTAVTDIENLESSGLSTDRKIFEQCAVCDIIRPTQKSTIEFLWGQRCIYAHPYNTSPSIEDLDYIINQAVTIVLSKEVDFNKNYIDEFCSNIITRPHLVDNDENKILQLANNILVRVKENLHPYYFKKLFFYYGSNLDKPNEIKKIEIIVKHLILKTTYDFSDKNWAFESRAISFAENFTICVVDQNFWAKVDDRVKDVLINYFVNLQDNNTITKLAEVYGKLQSLSILEDEYKNKFFTKLDSLRFSLSIYYYGNADKQFERIIKELKTWQFSQMNVVIDFIDSEFGINALSNFNLEQNIELGRVLYASADEGHWKSRSLIAFENFNTSKLSKEIFAGIIIGHFINIKNEVRFDDERAHFALKVLNELDDSLIDLVYAKIFDVLDNGTQQYPNEIYVFGNDTMKNIANKVNLLKLKWKSKNFDNYNLLDNKVKKYFQLP